MEKQRKPSLGGVTPREAAHSVAVSQFPREKKGLPIGEEKLGGAVDDNGDKTGELPLTFEMERVIYRAAIFCVCPKMGLTFGWRRITKPNMLMDRYLASEKRC
ncbi:hypothetical protein TNIN_483271 [Trichonephila inaurata madagascariensis]|uniref:Uncharacterized protein n=1 Tax=Trichonephila inaurata madagascariensis TaxID=2747483 RepID=A0A8X6YHL4_9ARAC|nr:hypothetical protein TNIN_483271 [Trichonephila inaurata madagascariensis]